MAAQLTATNGFADAIAVLINGAGDQFFAGASFAADQNGDRLSGDAPDLLINLLHGAAVADDGVACGLAAAHLHRLRHQAAAVDRFADEIEHLLHLERLEQIIVSAEFGRFDGGLSRAMGGHENDRQTWIERVQFS